MFAEKKANLIICARREEKLLQLKKSLEKEFNVGIHAIQLDIRHEEEIQNAIDSLPEKFRNIDVLINNAGLAAGLSSIQEGNIDDWNTMIDTNVKGLLYVTRHIVPKMIERQQGHIVNIGSIAGLAGYPNGNVYCATKHAVRVLSECFRMDLLGTKIRVSNIEPGLVETEFSLVRFKETK